MILSLDEAISVLKKHECAFCNSGYTSAMSWIAGFAILAKYDTILVHGAGHDKVFLSPYEPMSLDEILELDKLGFSLEQDGWFRFV